MGGHYLYILECSDGTLYTGYTTDLARRLKEHSSGRGSKYTRGRLPVKLFYSEELKSKHDALTREASVKMLGRSAKLLLGALRNNERPTAPASFRESRKL